MCSIYFDSLPREKKLSIILHSAVPYFVEEREKFIQQKDDFGADLMLKYIGAIGEEITKLRGDDNV